MKKKFKDFLNTCNCDRDNQLCYGDEYKIAMKLIERGFIEDIEMVEKDHEGEFLIWL